MTDDKAEPLRAMIREEVAAALDHTPREIRTRAVEARVGIVDRYLAGQTAPRPILGDDDLTIRHALELYREQLTNLIDVHRPENDVGYQPELRRCYDSATRILAERYGLKA